jgi:hypothetical protein
LYSCLFGPEGVTYTGTQVTGKPFASYYLATLTFPLMRGSEGAANDAAVLRDSRNLYRWHCSQTKNGLYYFVTEIPKPYFNGMR